MICPIHNWDMSEWLDRTTGVKAWKCFKCEFPEHVDERTAIGDDHRFDAIELHRAVHQAASHELDMGTTWKQDRVQAFAGRIAKRVVDVAAADRSETDQLRSALARVEQLAEELSRDTHAAGGSGVGPFIAQEIRNRIAGVKP